MHVETISTGNGRRIERIGSDPRIPGVRRIEWHEAAEPDGTFLRLPLADLVCTLNLGVVGEYRLPGERRWHAFPRIAARGISSAPSEGRDPAHGVLGYVSIVIAPWAFPIYTGLAAAPLANRVVDLAAASAGWRTMGDQLQAQDDGRNRVQCVATFLSRIAAEAVWPVRTAQVLDAIAADEPVAALARRAGLSTRRVHQLCVSGTGHNPSTYRKIARFGRLMQALHQSGLTTDWSAHVREYADHSHAIREFRRLAGMTPRRYAATRATLGRTYSIVPHPDTANS